MRKIKKNQKMSYGKSKPKFLRLLKIVDRIDFKELWINKIFNNKSKIIGWKKK